MLNLSSDSKHRNQKTHICPVFVNPATAGVDQAEGVETGQEGEGECQGDHGETCGEGNTFLQYQWVVTWCVRSGEPGRTGHSAARLPIYLPQPRTGRRSSGRCFYCRQPTSTTRKQFLLQNSISASSDFFDFVYSIRLLTARSFLSLQCNPLMFKACKWLLPHTALLTGYEYTGQPTSKT